LVKGGAMNRKLDDCEVDDHNLEGGKARVVKTACVIGATSSLSVVLCRELAKAGWNLHLIARDEGRLKEIETDIMVRHEGVVVTTQIVDLSSKRLNPKMVAKEIGCPDGLFLLAGDMGSYDLFDSKNIEKVTRVTYVAPVQIIAEVAKVMSVSGSGSIVFVSSVAGDRGRGVNAPYGAAKAALTAFASGLRQKLYGSGVNVLTVKPGFVDTSLTWGMDSPLMASRGAVVRQVIKAVDKRRQVIYTPSIWMIIMFVIRHIPEWLFKRLKF